MKQYKGLDVPEIVLSSARITQDVYCNGCTCDFECKTCIFDNRNIEQFKQWLKDKEEGE